MRRFISVEVVGVEEALQRMKLLLMASAGTILLVTSFSLFSTLVLKSGGFETTPLCLFLNVTGVPCPFCGLTRSLVSLLSGDFLNAFSYHPLGPLVWGGAFGFAANSIGFLSFQRRVCLGVSRSTRLVMAALLILVLWVSNILWGHY